MELLLVLLIPLFVFFNRFRGTKGWGGAAGGAVVAGVVAVFSENIVAALAAGGAYAVGEAMGWGRWLSLVPRWFDGTTQAVYWEKYRQPDRGKIIHNIANKIAREDKDFKKYSQVALVIRGAYWWALVAIALAVTGVTNPIMVPVAILLGATMPFCYALGYKFFGVKDYWKRGENIYGGVHGLILMLLLV